MLKNPEKRKCKRRCRNESFGRHVTRNMPCWIVHCRFCRPTGRMSGRWMLPSQCLKLFVIFMISQNSFLSSSNGPMPLPLKADSSSYDLMIKPQAPLLFFSCLSKKVDSPDMDFGFWIAWGLVGVLVGWLPRYISYRFSSFEESSFILNWLDDDNDPVRQVVITKKVFPFLLLHHFFVHFSDEMNRNFIPFFRTWVQ